MKKIAIVNFKGGVGKTTSCYNLAHILAKNRKILLLDLDIQANLTMLFGIEPRENYLEWFRGDEEANILMTESEKIDIIPSALSLANSEIGINTLSFRESILKERLKKYEEYYDICLMDCGPSRNIISTNAFIASDYILVPCQAEYLSIMGLQVLDKALNDLNKKIDHIFITQIHSRNVVNREGKEILLEMYNDKLLKSEIRLNTKLRESQLVGKSIFKYDKYAYGSVDYSSLADEIIEKIYGEKKII